MIVADLNDYQLNRALVWLFCKELKLIISTDTGACIVSSKGAEVNIIENDRAISFLSKEFECSFSNLADNRFVCEALALTKLIQKG